MPERLRFGLRLDDLTQEHLDEIVARYERTVNPGLKLNELLGEHPLKLAAVREEILQHGVIERNWDGMNAFRIQANPYRRKNPLISFSFESDLAYKFIEKKKIFEMSAASYLLDQGLAVEI